MPSPVKTYRLESSIRVATPLEEVFDFFSRADNLQILTPPWLDFEGPTPGAARGRRGA